MKYAFLVLMLLSQAMFGADVAQKAGLIVTIDQKSLGGFEQFCNQYGINGVKPMLDAAKALGHFGEALGGLSTMLEENKYTLIDAWDNARRDWIERHARGKYTNVYYILGDDTRDNAYMAFMWKSALDENDVVDYVSMVHGPYQLIKPEWKVRKDKLRMVYSEACQGGSGKDHFVKLYGALVSAGHNADTKHEYSSASPFFSFAFLKAWLNGNNFEDSLAIAWTEGSTLLNNPQGFALAKQMANFASLQQALLGSKIFLSWNTAVSPQKITIDTDVRKIVRTEEALEAHIE